MATEHNTIFQLAADYVQFTNENIFLTGKAGTGKTTFLRYIKEQSGKQTAIIAPTGVAAINAGGTTIHSFFQLPFTPFVPGPIRSSFDMREVQEQNERMVDKHHLLGRLKLNREKRDLIRQLDLLIIDEISMVRCDTLDAIDTVMRHFRNRYHEPFGGAQVLLIGDMHQLPPVIPNEEWEILNKFYSSPYFFSSKVSEIQPPVYIELEKIYRQNDPHFIDVLNKVRNHQMDEHAMEILHSRYQPNFSPAEQSGYITLTTHNNKAATLNHAGLEKLTGVSHLFKAQVEGEFGDKSYPAEENMELKVGAQVMFIKNDKEKIKRYFNGKIGTIEKIEAERIYVKCNDLSESIMVVPEKWENIRYSLDQGNQQIKEETIGSFTQYPLRLAWAITIHKSQGLTFEKAIIDAGSAFAPGQVYVALSRCTSLEGLVLQSQITQNSLFTDERILAFDKTKSNAAALENNLLFSKQLFLEKTIIQLFNLDKANEAGEELFNLFKEHKNSFNNSATEWVSAISNRLKSLQQVGQKFEQQLIVLFQGNEKDIIKERIKKASAYFLGILNELLEQIPQSPVVSDSRNYSKEYDTRLRSIYADVYTKQLLISTSINGFDMEHYALQKAAIKVPYLPLNTFAGAAVPKNTNSPHPELFQELREVRDEICKPDNTPIYMVASSSTIEEMVRRLPQTPKELLEITGFGLIKVQKYGEKFLKAIRSYCEEKGIESQMENTKQIAKTEKSKPTSISTNKLDKEPTASHSFRLYNEGLSLEQIAEQRNLTVTTIEGHLAQMIKTGDLPVLKLLSQEKLNAIMKGIETIGIEGGAAALMDFLGEGYSFPELRYGINHAKFLKEKQSE